MALNIPNFKCIIIGDAHTGKRSFIKRFSSELGKETNANITSSHPVLFSTNFGTIFFNIYDPDGEEVLGNVKDSFFKDANCAIIMFDLTSQSSYDSVLHWYRKIIAKNGKIPIALCGNNSHAKSKKVQSDKVKIDWESRMKYFEISNRDFSSINEPFAYLTQKLLKKGMIVEISKMGSEAQINLRSLHNLIDVGEEKNCVENCQ